MQLGISVAARLAVSRDKHVEVHALDCVLASLAVARLCSCVRVRVRACVCVRACVAAAAAAATDCAALRADGAALIAA